MHAFVLDLPKEPETELKAPITTPAIVKAAFTNAGELVELEEPEEAEEREEAIVPP